ncbi:hypothetical protein M378DRAFT_158843 [Amanita muscaria Koide BX008]|uniref:Uncharacterized protein n=1 Tax=Amanita muscaria (strain Koide BX008) TaxID=946122 RepID=A0A0C2TMB5_AMAMK|nr:hypothetical protein M378DRAFT_158843 [Amanita muscaria Koide BX008]
MSRYHNHCNSSCLSSQRSEFVPVKIKVRMIRSHSIQPHSASSREQTRQVCNNGDRLGFWVLAYWRRGKGGSSENGPLHSISTWNFKEKRRNFHSCGLPC